MSLRTSAAYVAVRAISGGLAMATLALVVRGLGPAGYGQLSLGLAMSAAVTLVLFNPINATLARFHAMGGASQANLRVLRRLLLGLGGGLLLLALMFEVSGLKLFGAGLLAAAAARNGWAGVVVDGCVRDVAELRAAQTGIRALGHIPLPTDRKLPGATQIPVLIQGVWVHPGNWLYADDDGMVVSDTPLSGA